MKLFYITLFCIFLSIDIQAAEIEYDLVDINICSDAHLKHSVGADKFRLQTKLIKVRWGDSQTVYCTFNERGINRRTSETVFTREKLLQYRTKESKIIEINLSEVLAE